MLHLDAGHEDIDHNNDPVIARRNCCQVNHDLLIVTVAVTGQIVALMHDRTADMPEIVICNDILTGYEFSVLAHKHGRITVNSQTGNCRIPSEADNDLLQSLTVRFTQFDLFALLQIDRLIAQLQQFDSRLFGLSS